MKKFISGLLLGLVISISLSVLAVSEYVINPNNYPFVINGATEIINALNIDGFTYVKLGDVGKAFNGAATVKFDEIKEVIEINTNSQIAQQSGNGIPEGGNSVVTEPTQNQSQGINVNVEAGQYLIDGMPVKDINGIKYIYPVSIEEKYYNKICLGYDANTKVLSLKTVDGKTLLESITTVSINDRTYIEYDYFISTILPLIK